LKTKTFFLTIIYLSTISTTKVNNFLTLLKTLFINLLKRLKTTVKYFIIDIY